MIASIKPVSKPPVGAASFRRQFKVESACVFNHRRGGFELAQFNHERIVSSVQLAIQRVSIFDVPERLRPIPASSFHVAQRKQAAAIRSGWTALLQSLAHRR